MTRRLSAVELLGYPVRLRGIQVGRPTDLVLDPQRMRVVGFDVLCGDEARRFLALPAARIGDGEIVVSSAFLLLDEGATHFYRERGVTLRWLRGSPVELAGRELGRLVDVVLDEQGAITHVAVDADPAQPVAVTPGLTIRKRPRQAA